MVDYREGDDEPILASERNDQVEAEIPVETPAAKSNGDTVMQELTETPITAFLVLVFQDRVDAVIGLPPEIVRQRDANMRDVRVAGSALHDDALISMVVQGSAREIGNSLKEAARSQAMKNLQGALRKTPGAR